MALGSPFLLLLLAGCPPPPEPRVVEFWGFRDAPPPTAEAALVALRQMKDPIVRGAAVSYWLRLHASDPAETRVLVCDALVDLENLACVRHVRSAHLGR